MLAGDRYAGTGGQRWMGWAQDRSDISVIVNPPYPSLLFATVQKMRTIPFPSQYTSILSPGGISTISAGKISSVTQISGMTCLHLYIVRKLLPHVNAFDPVQSVNLLGWSGILVFGIKTLVFQRELCLARNQISRE
jgi:hypothetical protein